MYRIGLFSRIGKTTIRTLRFYDRTGLLRPGYVDPHNGYRYYGSEQLILLQQIQSLRQAGLAVDEIRQVLSGGPSQKVLEERSRQLREEIRTLEDQLGRIAHFLSIAKGEMNMDYNPVIREIPECIVYSTRLVAPDYDSYFQLIPEIGAKVTRENPGLQCAEPEYCFIEYLDGEYREKDIHIEFNEAVTAYGKDSESIRFRTLPAATVASVLHKGPYSTLGEAYAYLFRWIGESDWEMTGNPRESYIDGIWNQEDESGWLTELQVPVRKKTK